MAVDDSGKLEKSRDAEIVSQRRRRRAMFLRELAEARALRERVAPRRFRVARLRRAVRMRSFRI